MLRARVLSRREKAFREELIVAAGTAMVKTSDPPASRPADLVVEVASDETSTVDDPVVERKILTLFIRWPGRPAP